MRNIIVIFVLAFLCSCSAEKMAQYHCSKCPTKDSTYVKVEIKDSVVPRDSVVIIPKVVLNIKDSVPCKDFKFEKQDKRARLKIEVKDSVMNAECVCDGIEIKLRWYEHHYTKLITQDHTLTRFITVKHPKTPFQAFKDWFFWICVVVLATLLTRWILKKFGKWPLPF